MALWMVRGGKSGEHEQKFFNDNRIYLTWDSLPDSLAAVSDLKAVRAALSKSDPNLPPGKLANNTGQIGAFLIGMNIGDWVVLPRKTKPAFTFGEITGSYNYDLSADAVYRHYRTVKWFAQDVPRSAFDQDLLYSFGAFMTICQIKRNDAEQRIRAMSQNGWKSTAPAISKGATTPATTVATDVDSDETVDLELLARDQIAKLIARKFKGHQMARLVEAILKAQGYTTYTSPPGPDKGIDILAAPGPLGFGRPRICVQVKSQDAPVDSPTLHQLVGAMQNVNADQGLLVAWGGFKNSVDKEAPNQFFRVRLWDQDDLIAQLLERYNDLPEDLRAELPLKRVWTLAVQEDED